MTTPTIPQVNRRRKTNLVLTGPVVDAIRNEVLPLLPGVSLSDIVDSFLAQFANAVVPVVRMAKDVPEHVRAATAESAMAEMLGRFIINSVRTDAPVFPPSEVDSG
jgi:hypothetical protein